MVKLIEQYVKHFRIIEKINKLTCGEFDEYPDFDPILELFGLLEVFKCGTDQQYELILAIFVNDKGYKSDAWADSIYNQLLGVRDFLKPSLEVQQQQLN